MRKKKKRKFKKPAAGMKPGGPVSQVSEYGYSRYKKGFIHDTLKHTVLTCTQISPSNQEAIEATLKTLSTGAQVLSLPDGQNGWSVRILQDFKADGMLGRAYVVNFNGIETALYYRRQLSEIKLLPGDTFPEKTLKDPDDAWVKINLLQERSAKQSNRITTNIQNNIAEENKSLKAQVKVLEELNGSIETSMRKVEDKLSWFTPAQVKESEQRKRKYIRNHK